MRSYPKVKLLSIYLFNSYIFLYSGCKTVFLDGSGEVVDALDAAALLEEDLSEVRIDVVVKKQNSFIFKKLAGV